MVFIDEGFFVADDQWEVILPLDPRALALLKARRAGKAIEEAAQAAPTDNDTTRGAAPPSLRGPDALTEFAARCGEEDACAAPSDDDDGATEPVD